MIHMNPLDTREEIQEYKDWLSSKSSHYLKCLLSNFRMDERREKPIYLKITLRVELATQELNNRNNNTNQ